MTRTRLWIAIGLLWITLIVLVVENIYFGDSKKSNGSADNYEPKFTAIDEDDGDLPF
ncbi:MAG TPA: hypothetical protein GXZ52_08415 [Clostridiales bacterium]|nr:hypothetical protein [Clostridiales bacterium]